MGIWRIPVDEIDRPGSFASHMNRSIVLLLDVLSQLKDQDTLLKVSFMLQRTPDQGKKYLRDVDRQVLAKRAFFLAVKVLEDNLNRLTGVSELLSKSPVTSMGEMTTTDTSKRPSSVDSKHVPPKKLGLSDGVAEHRPSDSPQTQPPLSADKAAKVLEVSPGKVDVIRSEGHRIITDEPMDLDSGLWRKPTSILDSQGNETRTETSSKEQRVADSSRTPELSLEELSISSRQQQLQASAAKVTMSAGGADQGLQRRPNRKRKLIEDVESGKTLLLDAYRVWQQGQKVMTYDLGRIEKIMSETYMLIKQVDEDVALDQALKFCQIQLASSQRQSAGDTPTTPKYSKDHRDGFFPTPILVSHPLTPQDGQTKVVYEPLSKVPRPQASSFHEQQQHKRAPSFPAALPFLPHPVVSTPEQSEGLMYRQQESHLCQQMKLASVSQGQEPKAATWFLEEAATCSTAPSCPDQQSLSEQSKLSDLNRIRSRVPPTMPKLFIPSAATKFPPEITVTPPTPTLLSPKGSISEETKQRLKNVILSSQSAATVKKDTLSQPSLEVQETSSQESSLESESDEEDDYMDV